jgi:hypothetical protein
MRFWIREVAGWILVGLGLWVFLGCLDLLDRGRPIEAGSQTVIGFIVFRGGIHLLKVAVAARVCLRANEELEERPAPRAPAPRARRAELVPRRSDV